MYTGVAQVTGSRVGAMTSAFNKRHILALYTKRFEIFLSKNAVAPTMLFPREQNTATIKKKKLL